MTLVEEPQPGTGYSYDRGFEEVKFLKNNPGPGQYQVTFSNQKSQPKFSLNKSVLTTQEQERRAKQNQSSSGVGPGSYNTDQSSLNVRGIQIGQRYQSQNKNENPGPASYNISRDHNSQPHLSFAQATRENLAIKDSVPASNQYQPNVTEMKHSNKGYIMMKSYKEDNKPKMDERPLYDLTKKKSNTAYRIAKPYAEENKRQKQEDKGGDMINLRDVYDRMKSNTAGSFGPKGGPLLLKKTTK